MSDFDPVLVALGANLSSRFGGPRETLEAALTALRDRGVRVLSRSRWYASPAWPPSDQPDYVNGVVRVETDLGPADLLACLHGVEAAFGRVRTAPNAARSLDLDLVAYGRTVLDGNITVPHPRLQDRAFVLLPLRDVAPDWVDPRDGQSLDAMIAALPPDDVAACRVLEA